MFVSGQKESCVSCQSCIHQWWKGHQHFPCGIPVLAGKTLPPHMCWLRRVKINRIFNLSKFSMGTTILLAVPVDTAGGAVSSSFFIPNFLQPHVREPVPFVWLTLCFLGKMNLEGCIYPAQDKHPSFRLNSLKCNMGYFPHI